MFPDFKWEEFQMLKHQSSLRLCWRRYCKRAAKQSLAAYSWASFVFFYGLPITLLGYGIREIGIILFGCVTTELVASVIPVLRIARKKPVDAIKNR